MKRLVFFTLLLLSLVLLSGCSRPMDKPRADGSYFYQNRDLGFALTLPAQFIYYQTQRKEGEGFTDIEIFVPTSDTAYPQEVPSYAKAVVVRVFGRDAWTKSGQNDNFFEQAGQSGGRIYGIKFWEKAPRDWQDKWSDEIKKKISASLAVD